MASLVNLVLLGGIFAIHTALAAVMTRFFRLRMKTKFGAVLYALFFIPVALFVTTLVFTGVMGIGVDLGSSAAALGFMIGMPLALGFTIDVLYIPAPDEVDLPAGTK